MFRVIAILAFVAVILVFFWPTLVAGGKRFRNSFTKLADKVEDDPEK